MKNFMRNLSLRKKIIFSIIPALIIVFIVLGISVYWYIKDNIESKGRREASLTAQNFASQLETEFAAYFNIEKQFNAIACGFEDVDINARRKLYVDLTRDLLDRNKELIAMWIDIDRNAFDGKDDKYKSVSIFPRSGRFNFAWQRADGKIEPEVEVEEHIVETLIDVMPYYVLPRQQKKTILIEPYYENYTGVLKAGEGILMTSIASPVFNRKNEVIGVTGIDIMLNNYIEFVEKIKPFEVGYATLYSPEARYLSHPDTELLEKTVLENPNFPKTIADSIHKQILEKEAFEMDFIDENDDRILIYFIPINTGIAGQEMMLAVYVPYEILIAKVKDFFIDLIVVISIALTIIITIIMMIANRLVQPLKKLTREAQKMIKGNLLLELDCTGNDEVGRLTEVVMFVDQTIMELIDEINKLTIAVTEGRLHVRGDSQKFQGAYYLLVEGVNEVMDEFVKPLEMATSFLDAVANGAEKIDDIQKEYKGDFNKLKDAINITLKCLQNFQKNIDMLTASVKAGDLSKRADTNTFKGDWISMIGGVNNIVETFADLIEESGSVLNTMATGDLTPRITKEYTGKFEAMKHDINHLGSSLSDLINEIKHSVEVTADSSSHITSTAKLLSEAALRQTQNTADIASAIEQMSKIVETNARNALSTAEVANNSGQVADNGQKVVQHTIDKMREIAEVVQTSSENIQKLGDSSQKIGEIVTVINSIAEQTNLLSLNAAIEAARAGESGKGFAVVADSVGKLAINTATATKQISSMIKIIQEDTKKAVLATEKGTMEVNNGIALANDAGTSLSNILNSINELLGMINHIADASQQQAETSESIAKNIEIIKNDADTSSKNVEEVASNSSELSELTAHLAEVMNNFKTGTQFTNNRLP